MAGCRTLEMAYSAGVSQQPTATNPDGDTSRLRVTWGTSGCVRGARANLSDGGHSIAITQYEIVPGCYGPLVFVGFELDLRTELEASGVSVTFAAPEPTPSPTPAPSPTPSQPSPDYVPDELIVRFCNSPSDAMIDALAGGHGLALDHRISQTASYLFRILDGIDPRNKAATVAEEPVVCGATPNWMGKLHE